MKLPPFRASIDANVSVIIDEKLKHIESVHDVDILFAVESGSRAWGFPSPDSDYDVRFVYAHKQDWYLSLEPGHDVIELPIQGDWDINGWDIRKALNLLLKPNPVLLEWLSSPIKYRWQQNICDQLIELANRTTFGEACLHHYRNLAQSQWNKHIGDKATVNVKKYFYVLRPTLAIHWIRAHPDIAPPMNLQSLVAGLPLSEMIVSEIGALLERKAQSKEVGERARVDLLDAYISEQIAWAQSVEKKDADPALLSDATALFRAILRDGAA